MTTPDTATIARELREIARTVRGEAQLNEPGWPLRLEGLGEQLAVIAERLRGQILIRLPEPDLTNPDTWTCRLWTVKTEPALPGGEPTIWLDGEPLDPDDAYELGHSLIAAVPRTKEAAVLPPARHSPGQTGHGDGKDTADHANDAHRAAETYDLEVLGEALRATGIKVEDVNPRHLREALIETSGPPWGQGRGAYLAGLLGKQFAEDKCREAGS